MESILNKVITTQDLDHVITTYTLNYQDTLGNSILHELARTGKIKLLAYLLDRKNNYNINKTKKETH